MLHCSVLVKEVKLGLDQWKAPGAVGHCLESSAWAQVYAHIQGTQFHCTSNDCEPHPSSNFETDVEIRLI